MDLFLDPLFLTFLILLLIAAVLWRLKSQIHLMVILSVFGFAMGTYLLWGQLGDILTLLPPPPIWIMGALIFLTGLLWWQGILRARTKFSLLSALILVLAYALTLTLLRLFI